MLWLSAKHKARGNSAGMGQNLILISKVSRTTLLTRFCVFEGGISSVKYKDLFENTVTAIVKQILSIKNDQILGTDQIYWSIGLNDLMGSIKKRES